MKKIVSLFVCFVCLISGCSCKDEEPVRTSIFSSYVYGYANRDDATPLRVDPFGSYTSFIGYKKDEVESLNDELSELVIKYHSLLDRNYYYKDENGNLINNLKVINDSYGTNQEINVDPIIIEALSEGIKYSKLSNGNFNIVSGAIVDVWDISINYTHIDPSEEDIDTAMMCVPNVNNIDSVLVVDNINNTVRFNSIDGCQGKASITLGAMAKSYFLDKLVGIEEFSSVGSAIYDAGQSSIILKGSNPLREGGYWNIVVNDSLNSNVLFATQAVKLQLEGNVAISTSGGEYKGYINSDGVRRHHIIDAKSGYPNSFVVGCSVVGESAMIMDIVSTTIMTMENLEEIKSYLVLLENNNIDVDVLLQVPVSDSEIKLYVNESMNENVNETFNGIELEVFGYGA